MPLADFYVQYYFHGMKNSIGKASLCSSVWYSMKELIRLAAYQQSRVQKHCFVSHPFVILESQSNINNIVVVTRQHERLNF